MMDPADLFSNLERKFKLPEGLLDSVWSAESGRGRQMVSPRGAKGHFQFMDATARQYGLDNPFDLEKSAHAAARYLSDLFKQTKDWTKAVASYNWGIGNVQKKGLEKAPMETRRYVPKVLGGVKPVAPATDFVASAPVPQQPQAQQPQVQQPQDQPDQRTSLINAFASRGVRQEDMPELQKWIDQLFQKLNVKS